MVRYSCVNCIPYSVILTTAQVTFVCNVGKERATPSTNSGRGKSSEVRCGEVRARALAGLQPANRFKAKRGGVGVGFMVSYALLSVYMRRVWDMPTVHVANWAKCVACSSGRMFIEVKILGRFITFRAALRKVRPRPNPDCICHIG